MDTPPRPRTNAWIIGTAVTSALTTAVLIAGLIVAFRATQEQHLELRRDLELARGAIKEVRAALHEQQEATAVPLSATVNNCVATNTEFTCTVTNLSDKAITTCARGSLIQKKASGVKLLSLPLCTGRVAPLETRTLSAPWSGGFAKDICSSPSQFGNDHLDWDVCDFRAEGFDIPAPVPAAATPAPRASASAAAAAL